MSQLDTFERYQKHSLPWFNKASDLHASAGALWLSTYERESKRIVSELKFDSGFDMAIAVPPVFRMLCGLSLELIYKAILVGASKKVPHHHKLTELARIAGVFTTRRENGLLQILTESIEWAGRYPVPKESQRMDALSDLVVKHLFEPVGEAVPGDKLRILKSSRALDWGGYDKLWQSAHHEFWHQREVREKHI